jgi:hypothetical protein
MDRGRGAAQTHPMNAFQYSQFVISVYDTSFLPPTGLDFYAFKRAYASWGWIVISLDANITCQKEGGSNANFL